MAETKDTPIWIGVDDGHYAIKGVGEWQRDMFLSRACMGRRGGYLGVGKKDSSCTYGTEDGDWTVDESLDEYARTRFDDYPKSALSRVFIHHMLRRMDFGGREVCVVTGLPVARYYTNNFEPSEGIISAKRNNLLQHAVSVAAPEKNSVASISRHIVMAQGVAMFFDQIMDMQGKYTKAKNGRRSIEESMAIVDIGGRTLDCLIVSGGRLKHRESRNLGGMDLEDAVSGALREHFNMSDVTPRMVMSAVANGTCQKQGEIHDVSELVKKQKTMFAEKIVDEVRACFGIRLSDADRMVLGGGAAQHIWDVFHKAWGASEMIQQAEYANARGMYKFGRFVIGNKQLGGAH